MVNGANGFCSFFGHSAGPPPGGKPSWKQPGKLRDQRGGVLHIPHRAAVVTELRPMGRAWKTSTLWPVAPTKRQPSDSVVVITGLHTHRRNQWSCATSFAARHVFGSGDREAGPIQRRGLVTDMPLVRSLRRDAANDDYRFSSLIMGVVQSPAFTMNMKSAADMKTAAVSTRGE